MALLDRLGFGTPAAPRTRLGGLRLVTRPDPSRTYTRKDIGVRLALLGALTILALLAFPNVTVYDGTAQAGEVWHADDVVAPFDFSIRLSPEAVAARRDSVRRAEPPIFAEQPTALETTLARLDSLEVRLDGVIEAYAAWQRSRAVARLPVGPGAPSADAVAALASAEADSVAYAAARSGLGRQFPERAVDRLAASALRGDALHQRLLVETERLARDLLARGVVDVPRDSLRAATVRVRNLDPGVRTEQEVAPQTLVTPAEVASEARRRFDEAFGSDPELAVLGAGLAERTLVPSLTYQAAATARARAASAEAALTTRGRVREGMTIIRRGDLITPDRHRQLVSLDAAQRERSGVSWLRTVAGRVVLVLSALTMFFLYLYLLRPTVFDDDRRLLLVALLLGLVLVGYIVAGALGGAAPYAVPVALVTILMTIVFDSRVGSFSAMALALLGGLAFGFDFEFGFVTLVAGVLAVFSVRDVQNRSRLLRSAGLVLLTYAVVLLGFALMRADPLSQRFLSELVAALVHAVLVLLAAPILLGVERGFGVTTDLTLLELSDTNRPLLKELSLRAPGTFNHVLQVANLAEAAADAVGCNAMRARVGALYHDIGKMLKPEYFIENQQPGDNPHDRLKPSMSALVIAAHVKDGVEVARENRLPRVVMDFISTHHGTSLIEFFYRKAQEAAGDDDRVDEADFRYPGPRPSTTEQAIVMLADSVEAASRSLEKPTPRRLEALIDAVVDSRVADGQLDLSPLTFSDLTRIKESFLTLLCGIYHFRVRYPGQEGEADADTPELPDEPEPSGVRHSVSRSVERSTLG